MSEERESADTPEVGDTPPKHEHEPAKQRSGGSGAFLATLLALAALGGSYYLWQQLEVAKRDLHALEGSVDKLLSLSEQRHQEQLQRLQEVPPHPHPQLEQQGDDNARDLQRLSQSLAELRDSRSQAGHGSPVAEVEYLLRIARHRLSLEHDPQAASAALRTARSRLALLDDPAFAPMIERIDEDIQALANTELPDREALAAEVGKLAADVEALPLASSTPQGSAPSEALAMQQSEGERGLWQRLWQDIRGLVTIRREGEVAQPM
ncbi:MAG: uroporphyrinogen-III C-methyltransferase, partial [Pseudomonadota bacterium]